MFRSAGAAVVAPAIAHPQPAPEGLTVRGRHVRLGEEMSRSEPPRSEPPRPEPLAVQRVVRCLHADIEATENALDLVRPGPAGRDLSYLDRLISKPWGSEFRVYEDALTEVW